MKNKVNISSISRNIQFIYGDECEKKYSRNSYIL